MNCEEFEPHITDYLEGTLLPAVAKVVEDHRVTCTECQRLITLVSQIIDTCHAMPRLDPQAELPSLILQKTPRKVLPGFSLLSFWQGLFRPILWPRAAVGATLMVGFLSLTINQLGKGNNAPEHLWKKANLFAHHVYSQGLKLYDRKNQWQAQLKFLSESLRNQIDYHLGEAGEDPRQDSSSRKEGQSSPPEPKKDLKKSGSSPLKHERSMLT
ncbi:MAG: hypothetical protein HYR55_11595 [Acidobacteria bacterium]|nr:hypothetical protein [Acidobacteriota bacterium]MBI3657150.1 hypothetical protein [Acidobacteriota bacterium]